MSVRERRVEPLREDERLQRCSHCRRGRHPSQTLAVAVAVTAYEAELPGEQGGEFRVLVCRNHAARFARRHRCR